MPAPKGNRFWEVRSSHGRNPIYSNPDDLTDAIQQYFDWVHENPYVEIKPMIESGQIANAQIPRLRPMLIGECYRFCGLTKDSWADYKAREGFSDIIEEAEEIIKNQKLSGAMAGFFKENIVARHLGIKDSSNVQLEAPEGITFNLNYGEKSS